VVYWFSLNGLGVEDKMSICCEVWSLELEHIKQSVKCYTSVHNCVNLLYSSGLFLW
jgi:hypothetical protein